MVSVGRLLRKLRWLGLGGESERVEMTLPRDTPADSVLGESGRPANAGIWALNAKIVHARQRITAAVSHYHVGFVPLRDLPGGQAVIAYFATYFAVFTILAVTLIH
jgi:hypothetical protein